MLTDKPYSELLALDPTQYSDLQILDFMGALFDFSISQKDVSGTTKGLEIASFITKEQLSPVDQARFHYYQANGWSNNRYFNQFEHTNSWDFDQQELTQEIFHLRSCIKSDGFEASPKELKCQAYTNLGNNMSHIGRFIEAQQMWHSALEIIPHFAMALGNTGQGYYYYADALYEESHRNIFIYHIFQYLTRALQFKKQLHPGPAEHWAGLRQQIANHWPQDYLEKTHKFDHFDLGNAKPLRWYRQWCLDLGLFINPLNDLGPYTDACHDILHLPAMTVAAGEPPKYYTLFNQMKQEYATARFLFYEGTQPHKQHYSDKDVKLADTLDYAEYSYQMEKVKIAFRLLYSIFDKIAYLLNDYLQIGLKRKSVSFRALWHEDSKGKKVLRQRFHCNRNLALRGLYWLSKDLLNVEDEDAHNEVLEPGARELAEIRNHIEHKSFKVVQYGTWGGDDPDNYTYSIDRGKFELKTLKLIGLVRSAMIYASLAIHHEEMQKPKGMSLPITLPDLLYEDKV